MSFEWSAQFVTGEPAIDAQHKVLVALTEELRLAVSERRGAELVEQTLEKLIGYVQYHFEFEEEWMERHGTPMLAAHRLEHVAITDKVLDLQTQFDSGDPGVAEPLLNLLREWLLEHICVADRRDVAYVREQSTRGASNAS